MTVSVGGLSVYLVDDTTRFQSGMRNAASQVEQSSSRMRAATGAAEASVRALGASTRGFAPDAFRSLSLSALKAKSDVDGLRAAILAVPALAGGFGGAILAQQVTQRADAYTNLKNRIASVEDSTRGQIAAERDLFQTAQATRSSLQANASLFARLKSSSPELAADSDKLMRTVETVQKSFLVGGATTQEAQSSALQLAQALGSGRLQGDELRSILENNIPLAKLISKEFGVSVGQLKELGSEGQLTSDRVIQAILKGSQEIDTIFARLKPTFAQSLQALDNSLTRTIGKFDEATGLSAGLASGIIGVANNLDSLAQSGLYAAAAIASVFAGRALSGAGSRVSGLVAEQKALRREALDTANAEKAVARGDLAKVRDQISGERSKALKVEEDALKRVNAQASGNLAQQIRLQDQIEEKQRSIGEARRKSGIDADTKALEQQVKAVEKLAAARERDFKAEQNLSAAMEKAGSEQNRKGLKPLYDAAFERDAARDARLAAESRSAAIRTELAKVEQAGPASRKKADVATFEQQRGQIRSAFEGAEKDRIASLQRYYDAEERFRTASDAANVAAEKRKTSAIASELAERTKARTALDAAEKQAAAAAVGGTSKDSASVLKDIQAQSRLQQQLEESKRQAALIGSAQTLQAGAVAQVKGAALSPDQVAATAAAIGKYRDAVASSEAAQDRARNGASALGAAWGVASRVGSSLFNFLGGPWGVALTAVTLGMAAFGISSANAAAKQEQFNKTLADGAEIAKAAKAALDAAKGRSDSENQRAGNRVKSEVDQLREATNNASGKKIFDGLSALRFADPEALGRVRREVQGYSGILEKLREDAPLTANEIKSLGEAIAKIPDTGKAGFAKARAEFQSLVDAALQAKKQLQEAAAASAQIDFISGRGVTDARDEALRRQLSVERQISEASRVPSEAGKDLNADSLFIQAIARAKEFEDAIARLGNRYTELENAGRAVDLGSPLSRASISAIEAQQSVAVLRADYEALVSRIETAGASDPAVVEAIRKIKDQSADGKLSVERFIEELLKISSTSPDASPIVSELLRVSRAAIAAGADVAAAMNQIQAAMSARSVASPNFRQSEITSMETYDLAVQDSARKNKRAAEIAQMSKRDRAIVEGRSRDTFASASDLGALYDAEQSGKKKRGGGGSGRKGFTPEQNFDNKISRIKEEGRAAFFTDLDRELISQLRELKADPGLAKRTTDAIISGGELPERAKELKAALELKKSGELARGARDQFGSLADVLPQVAERQRLLNIAVREGHITQEVANRSTQDYIQKLPQMQQAMALADGFGSAFERLATSLQENPRKAGQALKQFGLDLLKLGQQQFIFEPLKKGIRDLFSTIISGSAQVGGGGGGILGMLFKGVLGGGGGAILPGNTFHTGISTIGGLSGTGGLYHVGGMAGYPAQTRTLPLSTWSSAPRYHSGLKPNEFAAILEQGEAVLTGRQQAGVAAMADTAKGMSGGASYVQGDTYVTITGNADQAAIAQLKQEMARDRREFTRNVANANRTSDLRRTVR